MTTPTNRKRDSQKTSTVIKKPRKRLDIASLLLAIVGTTAGIMSYFLIENSDVTALALIPSVVATTVGLSNLTKLEIPH